MKEFENLSIDDIRQLAACAKPMNPEVYALFNQLLQKRLTSQKRKLRKRKTQKP